MPLNELVLDFLNELVLDFEGESVEEVRLTDRPLAVGDTVQIDDHE